MVLTPALPRTPGSDPDLYPDLALDDYPDPDPHPRLAGMTGEPDDIITWYVRPRRRRRISVPTAVTADAGHVWVADFDSVTELNAANGALVRVLTASRYGFNGLVDVVTDAARIWAISANSDSVTEFPAS